MNQGLGEFFISERLAAHLAIFGNQFTVAGIDPQRDLQADVFEAIRIR